jgi:hypothetical protein
MLNIYNKFTYLRSSKSEVRQMEKSDNGGSKSMCSYENETEDPGYILGIVEILGNLSHKLLKL